MRQPSKHKYPNAHRGAMQAQQMQKKEKIPMGTGLPPTEISHDQKPPVMRVSHLIPDMRAPCVCVSPCFWQGH